MTCKHCRKEFNPINSKYKYCSTECKEAQTKIIKREASRKYAKKLVMLNRLEKEKLNRPKTAPKAISISDINKKALNLGMSYGEYVLRTEVLK